MNQPQPAPQFGPQSHPDPQPGYRPAYPPPKPGMSGGKIALIIVGIIVGVLFLFGLLVGVLAVATIPKLSEAKQKLEVKQMGDLNAGLRQINTDDAKLNILRRKKELSGTRGEELWMQLLELKLLDDSLAPKLTSLSTNSDTRLEPFQAQSAGGLRGHCSFTLPRGSQLLRVMAMKGSERCVLFTLNSRNWKNYGELGVPCVWSDGDVATWLSFEQAQAEWGITQPEWDDPAGKLFGKKAPFQHTYE